MSIHSLIKFGDRKWMDEFQRGNLFCQQIKQFQFLEKIQMKHDDLAKRGDKFEGAYEVFSHEKVKLFINDIELDIAAPLRVNIEALSSCPIFCMYAIKTVDVESFLNNEKEYLISGDVEHFGDTAVFVTDLNEFINRVKSASKQRGFNLKYGLVEYIDVNETSGKWGPFKKPKEFDFQSEFRLMLDKPVEEPAYILEIGDISDITVSIPIKNIRNMQLVDSETGELLKETS